MPLFDGGICPAKAQLNAPRKGCGSLRLHAHRTAPDGLERSQVCRTAQTRRQNAECAQLHSVRRGICCIGRGHMLYRQRAFATCGHNDGPLNLIEDAPKRPRNSRSFGRRDDSRTPLQPRPSPGRQSNRLPSCERPDIHTDRPRRTETADNGHGVDTLGRAIFFLVQLVYRPTYGMEDGIPYWLMLAALAAWWERPGEMEEPPTRWAGGS